MYDTILVPTDGSDGANRAIAHAMDLAERYDATVHALFVVDTRLYGEPARSSVELVIDDLEDEGHELLADLAADADNRGVTLETRCCHGIPYEEITNYADEVDADLVVMGYQGQTHTRHVGSNTERVVRESERPVLAV